MDEVLCDVTPFEIFDVLLLKQYLWKQHIIYESIRYSNIISLGSKLYRIQEVALPTTISLLSAKKCSKIISKPGKFVLFLIPSQSRGRS